MISIYGRLRHFLVKYHLAYEALTQLLGCSPNSPRQVENMQRKPAFQ